MFQERQRDANRRGCAVNLDGKGTPSRWMVSDRRDPRSVVVDDVGLKKM